MKEILHRNTGRGVKAEEWDILREPALGQAPEPLDEKIKQGLALVEPDSTTLTALQDRLTAIFEQLRIPVPLQRDLGRSMEDTSSPTKPKEYGVCIAYGIGLDPRVYAKFEEALIETAQEQNHGMIPEFQQDAAGSLPPLWGGRDTVTNRAFHIVRYEGLVPLQQNDQHYIREGVVYSLHSSALPR